MARHADKKPTVAVIGAGFAGLRCAAVLLQSGFDVTVYEARNRIGGRVYQVSSGGHLVDVGANWIHEPNDNPIMEIAKQTNTVLFPRPPGLTIHGSDGKRKSPDYSEKVGKSTRDILNEASEYSLQHSADIDPNTSVMDYFTDEATKAHADQPEFLADMINDAARMGQWDGEPIESLNLKYHCVEDGPGGNDCFVASTYKDIVSYVAQPLLEKGMIKLGQQVRNITRNPGQETERIVLELSNEMKVAYDEAVVTCPLGWLKRHHQTFFTPALPPKLSKAIDNTGFGRLEKLYLTFPTAFWLPSSFDKEKPSPPAATHFHHPSYTEKPFAYPANQVTYSLAHLPGEQGQPTLLFYMHGPFGAQVCQAIKDLEPHSQAYNEAIDGFAQPFYSRHPNFNAEDPNCKPVSWFCSAWQNDELAGYGAYSYFPVGQIGAVKDTLMLRGPEGLGEQESLWFAGEHTAPFSRLGTTVGAYLSGDRVAENICRKWGTDMVKE